MNGKKFIIIGTDTNIGKTYVTTKLLEKYNNLSLTTLGLKPISTGGERINNLIYNEDAILLQKYSSVKLEIEEINPFNFSRPTSPNIAADFEKAKLDTDIIIKKIDKILSMKTDLILIETVGGLAVPINNHETMLDFVKKLNLPVILIVGIKLGCINHAILTYKNLLANNIKITGWIANDLGKMQDFFSENISTIRKFVESKFLGIVKYNQKAEEIINIIDL